MADGKAAARSRRHVPAPAPAPSAALRADRLDELIHQRTRLAIVSALAAGGRLSFNDLKGLLELSDGNLSVHARRLEDAGYVRCVKSFRDRLPHTEFELTAAGRRALERYVAHMEAILDNARVAQEREP